MIYFVTKRTRNDLTKMFLKFYRFVDNFILGNSSKHILFQAATELERALNSLDFHLKRIISNHGWHLDQQIENLGQIWKVPVIPGETEQIFGHIWDYNADKLLPKL